jgi:NADH-quinone oxidoreductase subunit C
MSDATDTTTDATTEAPETEDGETPETDERRQGWLDALTGALGDAVVGSHIAPGRTLWVRVERDAWFDAADAARGRLGCTFFDFLSAIDWMPSPWGRYEYSAVDVGIKPFDPTAPLVTGVAGGDTRFQLFCRVVNVRKPEGHPVEVIIKADLPDDDLRARSLVPLYGGANWHERECWEMFGITFDGHPGLRHLYLPGAFEGHPLRKDFPLLARLVKPWPGIVDVEPMPGEPEAAEPAANGDGDADAGGGGS